MTTDERASEQHRKLRHYVRITNVSAAHDKCRITVGQLCPASSISRSRRPPVPAAASRMVQPVYHTSARRPKSPVRIVQLCDQTKTCPMTKCSSVTCASMLPDSATTHTLSFCSTFWQLILRQSLKYLLECLYSFLFLTHKPCRLLRPVYLLRSFLSVTGWQCTPHRPKMSSPCQSSVGC